MNTPVQEWYRQLAVAAETPGLAQHLVARMGELLPRFAAFYRLLRSLPRRFRRALARTRGLSYASVALLLALCGGPVDAALIVVDETTCHLVDAVDAANTDVARKGCPAGSGEDFILLDSDVTLDEGRSFVSVTSPVTIQAGKGSTIDGGGAHCFYVEETGEATFAGVTIQNCAANYGAAIANRGTLTLDGVTARSCVADYAGGAIWSRDGIVTIMGSTITGNTCLSEDFGPRSGGGVGVANGTLTILDSNISGNMSYYDGGGVYNGHAAVTITGSTISGNDAQGFGGGVFSWGGGVGVTISNSTISGNGSHGVQSVQTELIIRNTSITGNLSVGVSQYDGDLTIEHSLIAGNAGEVSVPLPVTVTESFNLFGTNGNAGVEGFTPDSTDIVPAAGVMLDDILLPLADNGGPTQTHALVAGGPAVDAVPTSHDGCLGTVDQRGVSRPQGPACDIGSFELEASGLAFPLASTVPCESGDCNTPCTAAIGAVVDHDGTPLDPIGPRRRWHVRNGRVEAYTGQAGDSAASCDRARPGYANAAGTPFVVNGHYVGDARCGDAEDFLGFDGSPGYDFPAAPGTSILAAGAGTLRKASRDPVNDPQGRFDAWARYHTFLIDHGDGTSTWYLHAEGLAPEVEAEIEANGFAVVTRGQAIATVGSFGLRCGEACTQLHFEVRVAPGGVAPEDGAIADPFWPETYLWADSCGSGEGS